MTCDACKEIDCTGLYLKDVTNINRTEKIGMNNCYSLFNIFVFIILVVVPVLCCCCFCCCNGEPSAIGNYSGDGRNSYEYKYDDEKRNNYEGNSPENALGVR